MTTVDVLNRLSVAHSRSLATYLSYAVPWIPARQGEAGHALRRIAQDHQVMADRLGAMILEFDGSVEPGKFPLKYTALHDLAFDYLLQLLVEYQQQMIQTIEHSAEQLSLVPAARSLAEEALGEAKAHLEILEQMAADTAQS